MIKKQYQEPKITVVEFNMLDVIRTSSMSESDNPANWDNEDWIDLGNGGFFQ